MDLDWILKGFSVDYEWILNKTKTIVVLIDGLADDVSHIIYSSASGGDRQQHQHQQHQQKTGTTALGLADTPVLDVLACKL